MTSRETKRFIVPKGWPMKGREGHETAEIEAKEEAGLLGRARPKPIGSYLAWKKGQTSAQLVRVKVYLLEVTGQLETWKEKGQRQMAWMAIEDAALLVDEPGLAAVLLELPHKLPKLWKSGSRPNSGSGICLEVINRGES
jgi:8-oxo-dGTP pyrophosphatase MutT (NUDIX family)